MTVRPNFSGLALGICSGENLWTLVIVRPEGQELFGFGLGLAVAKTWDARDRPAGQKPATKICQAQVGVKS